MSPPLRYLSPSLEIVDDQDQLVIVIAIKHLDIDAGLCHAPREQAELTRYILLQLLDEHFPLFENLNTNSFECLARSSSVREEEMCYATSIHDPRASTLNAHTRTPQGLSHLGESAGTVFKKDCQIFHDFYLSKHPTHHRWPTQEYNGVPLRAFQLDQE